MQDGLTAFLGAFVDELARTEVRDVVVSPGSRSTPLALLFAAHPDIKVWMNIDERSAGFFALGMAKASRKPVALLCTSGTAAANYMPAVVEANLSRVPLIVLTADRPHELRDVGAPQTINQIGLYGNHVKWFVEMALPESLEPMGRYARMIAGRATSVSASSPAGAVHLNFPLREPLLPDLDAPYLWQSGREKNVPFTEFKEGKRHIDPKLVSELTSYFSEAERGLIVCGPHDDPELTEAVIRLAERLQYPIVADPLSQLRSGPHDKKWIIDAYDAFLRDDRAVKALQPEVIIRFGAMPVSKPYLQFISKYPACKQFIIDESVGWREPTLLASHMVYADPVQFCEAMTAALPQKSHHYSQWAALWQEVNKTTREVINDRGYFKELFEGQVFMELQETLPPHTNLFVGNSMPIRDLDTFFSSNALNVRVFGNRGANGIDGLVSTALGISAVDEQVVLVLGDLSLYHDMNGLLAAKLHGLNATVILINNDGGGIFSFLPQAGLPAHFEQLFGTPIGLPFEHAAALYGGTYSFVESWSDFRTKLQQSIDLKGLNVIEVRTDRESNVTMHRELWRKLSLAITPLLNEGGY